MFKIITKGFLGLGKITLKPQATLAMNLEVKALVVEEVLRRELMSHESDCEVTETDRMTIKRLTYEQVLTGEEIVKKVLENHK